MFATSFREKGGTREETGCHLDGRLPGAHGRGGPGAGAAHHASQAPRRDRGLVLGDLIGRGYPAPRQKFRWCTERLKIRPSNKFILGVVHEFGEAMLVLGTRRAERQTRAGRINAQRSLRVREQLLRPNASLPNSLVYTPIEDWTKKIRRGASVDVAGAGWWNCSTCRGVVHRSALRRWRFPLKTTEYELSAISWSSTAATPIGIIGQNAETLNCSYRFAMCH